MSNFVKGEIPLRLADGRTFTLVLDFEGLVEAEGAYRQPLDQLMLDANLGFVGAMRALLFGALRAKHPAITLRDASAMFQTSKDEVLAALTAAVAASFPDKEETPEGGDNKNPPGKSSGRSGARRGSNRTVSGG